MQPVIRTCKRFQVCHLKSNAVAIVVAPLADNFEPSPSLFLGIFLLVLLNLLTCTYFCLVTLIEH